MEIKSIINTVRRSVMQALTQDIGRTDSNIINGPAKNIRRILICRPNQRLGNLLLITPLLQEVTATYPRCKIDLFVKGNLAPEILRNYNNIDNIIQLPKKPFTQPFRYLKSWLLIRQKNYDLAINVDKKSSSGRLSVKFAHARFKFFGDSLSESLALLYFDCKHMAKAPVYDFRFAITQENILDLTDKVPYLDLKLDLSELSNGLRILRKIVPEGKKVISLFTYATGDKCHSAQWWEEFYEKVRLNFFDYTIVEILPFENVSKIGFKALTFYSRNIREIGSVIANTSIFIGADSGIMHLASAAKVPVIGLFNVTDPLKYGPYNGNSIAIETYDNDIEDIIEILDTILRHRLQKK
ncbi:glycosyltransferase family 9 protein [Flavobacterium sp. CF136]|uniref:glycosyltransferase family 9 protein n=1 Tax=Flavobacterium sp. (strain CF136) TaxID=1144313 RepID=UPI0002718585|nr:glycosyltransferase family 9 protein [Flavobacterium sp. CF136]EJL62777.1 ADP-heptose:LPS heptosyltransferase [Flavobacterium sp. CF136]